MVSRRKVEIFSAGCPVCTRTVETISRLACPSCEVTIQDMRDPMVAGRSSDLGIASVPAVVIDGRLVDRCRGRGPNEGLLRTAGLGQPL